MISHGQATQISLTKCLHMNDVITVTNVLVSYPGSCWVRFWYRCDLHVIVYLPFMTTSFLQWTLKYTHKLHLQSNPAFSSEDSLSSIPHHGTFWRYTINYTQTVSVGWTNVKYESLIPYTTTYPLLIEWDIVACIELFRLNCQKQQHPCYQSRLLAM